MSATTTTDPYWLRLAGAAAVTFVLALFIVDMVKEMPTEIERCTARMMGLMQAAQPEAVVSAQQQAGNEIRAIRMCSGHG